MIEASLPRLAIPTGTDPAEFMFAEGLTDGLPCVPPTLPRLRWMLAGTDLPPETVLGKMPPILAPVRELDLHSLIYTHTHAYTNTHPVDHR